MPWIFTNASADAIYVCDTVEMNFPYTFLKYEIKLYTKTKEKNRNPVGSKPFLMKLLVEWKKKTSRAIHA